MPIQIVRNDITRMHVDAIVNTGGEATNVTALALSIKRLVLSFLLNAINSMAVM